MKLQIRMPALLAVAFYLFAVAAQQTQASEIVIENAFLSVTVSLDTGRIAVHDKRANHTWRQPPVAPERQFALIRRTETSVSFSVTLHDDEGSEVPLPVTLELVGGEPSLRVRAEAKPKLQIASFDFLEPFLYESPDGFIAIADWSNGHIYPCNLDAWPGYDLDSFNVNYLLLPWAAVIDLRTGLGYSVTMETPDDAMVRCIKFGNYRAPLIRWIPQRGQFGYDRSVLYTFTDSGGYVGLAKSFRGYARRQGWLVTLKEKARSNPNIKRLFGAALLWDYFKNIDGVEAYSIGVQKAIHHVSKWDSFYNYPRVFEHDSFRRFEDDIVREENALGWLTEEYIQLADAFPVSERNLLPNENFDRPQTFMTDSNGRTIDGWKDERGQMTMRCSAFFLKRARQTVASRLAFHPINSIYFDVSTQRELVECYNPLHPRTRSQYKTDIIDTLKHLKSLGLVVHGECAKWWTVPYQDVGLGTASVLYSLPWHSHPAEYGQTEYPEGSLPADVWQKYETWGTLGHRNRVPLWELVFHDCIVSTQRESDPMDWTSGTKNLPFSYADKKAALCVLFGTMPTYYHCIVPQSAGAWTRNRMEFIRTCRNACKSFEVLADKEMLRHEFLTPDRDVQRTDWEGGTTVVCNFGSRPYTARVGDWSRVLPPVYGWMIKGPEIEAYTCIEQGREITRIRLADYYFTDEDGVSVALRRIGPRLIRVNADYPGSGELTVHFRPSELGPGFTGRPAAIWQVDPKTGKRVRALPFRFEHGCVEAGPFTDWVVLDVMF